MEVLVSLALLGMVLLSATTYLVTVFKMVRATEELSIQEEKVAYTQSRLNDTLGHIQVGKAQDNLENGFYFLDTELSSLVFVYDNLVDRYPWFSDVLLGKIILDSKKQLVLYSWPYANGFEGQSDLKYKKEILSTDIEAVNFEFYQVDAEGSNASWRDVILDDMSVLFIKLHLTYRALEGELVEKDFVIHVDHINPGIISFLT